MSSLNPYEPPKGEILPLPFLQVREVSSTKEIIKLIFQLLLVGTASVILIVVSCVVFQVGWNIFLNYDQLIYCNEQKKALLIAVPGELLVIGSLYYFIRFSFFTLRRIFKLLLSFLRR